MKILKNLIIFFLFFYKSVNADDQLPEFKFPDTEEKTHSIIEWKNKLLIINFWATWCQPCLKEIPEFIKLQTRYTTKNVQFVGIAIDEVSSVIEFKKKILINYPILISNEWDGFNLAQQLGNLANTVPYSIVVLPSGKIIYKYAGEVKINELTEVIEKTIKN